jgi:cell division protein FtsW
MRAVELRRSNLAAPTTATGQVRRHAPDYWLLLITLALLAIGVIVVYSISPALAVGKGVDGMVYVTRQLIAIGIGLFLFFIASRMPLIFWRKMAMPLLIVAAIATVITLLLPVNTDYPAHRWIRIGGFSFQSVELLKFALILWVAGFLVYQTEKQQISNVKATVMPILYVLLAAGIIVSFLQSDLGSAAVIAFIILAMLFVSGVPMRRILIITGILALGALVMISFSEYRRERVTAFLNPSIDCASTASGYQACQALIAVGSGGMTGLGLGNSVQAYGYLPEAENDSIFAIYAEKFGFIGGIVLLGLLLALFARIKRVIDGAPDEYSRLIVLGILVWLSTQSFINIGAMLGILPLKGITLPLISYGGSSVLMVLVVLGIVFNVSRYTSFNRFRDTKIGKGDNEDSRNGRRFRGSYHPPLSGRV